jgi:hypothetical protein
VFNNASSPMFFVSNGVVLRMSFPYNSPHNGKVECTLCSINNMICSLFFQASILACYWVEELHTATYLLNHLPTKTISMPNPFVSPHGVSPSYEHLRVFGCTCYPNLYATTTHKLAPRSTKCVFLGYSINHKGYCYIDLSTNCIIIPQHVPFDEADFPFSTSPHLTNDLDISLQDDTPSATPMPTPQPAPSIPSGFHSSSARAGMAGSLTSPCGGQTTVCPEDGGLTAPIEGQTPPPPTRSWWSK